jgi:hypothetical protein
VVYKPQRKGTQVGAEEWPVEGSKVLGALLAGLGCVHTQLLDSGGFLLGEH